MLDSILMGEVGARCIAKIIINLGTGNTAVGDGCGAPLGSTPTGKNMNAHTFPSVGSLWGVGYLNHCRDNKLCDF